MALSLTVFMAGTLDQATADSLLERAKGICPYLDAWLRNIASARPPSRSRASMTTTETSCACSTRASARPRRPAPTMATSTTSDSTAVISPLRRSQQFDGHRLFGQHGLTGEAQLGADADEPIELVVFEPLDLRQALAPFLYEQVARSAVGLAVALVLDALAYGEQCLQQGRAGGNVVGLARRQYGHCGHDGDLDKRLRIKNDE
ncbi:hypothetical protein OKW42_008342 [Paraburkholderia sp. WC7.3d]